MDELRADVMTESVRQPVSKFFTGVEDKVVPDIGLLADGYTSNQDMACGGAKIKWPEQWQQTLWFRVNSGCLVV